MSTKKVELAIVGSGPAGLSAAATAAEYGVETLILDEQPRPGGRLMCQLHKDPEKAGAWLDGIATARELLERVRAAKVEILCRTEVAGVCPGWSLVLGGPGRGDIETVEAKTVLVAAGGAENGLPFPGWTRPGVITVGAAQTMMVQNRLLPGQRVLVVGTDPLAISVAMEMAEYGATVVGVVLPPPGPTSGAMASPKQAMTNVSRLSDLAPNPALRALGLVFKKAAGLGVHLFPKSGVTVQHVPFMLRRCIVDTTGEPDVQSAILADLTADGQIVAGSEQEVKVDTVCISGGLYPLAELAEACLCASSYIAELGGRVPIHGSDMQTTQAGLFVAGSATGIEGAQVALAQGKMAGIGIAAYLGRIAGNDAARLLEQASAGIETARHEALITFNPDVRTGRSKQAQLWQNNHD